MSVFALVDCNNFYVSCERVFCPSLRHRPVVVLSNNDGCIVARSNEVKNMAIPMGAPYFKYRKELENINTAVFSSNYSLYGDMSARVMSILSQFCQELEIYSIDEAFLNLRGVPAWEIDSYCRQIQDQVMQCTGIPVSIGVSNTKTLAKLANEIVKKDSRKGEGRHNGVLNLLDLTDKEMSEIFKKTSVGDLWGVGRQYTKMLERNNIRTVSDLLIKKRDWVKKNMTIQGLRLVNELRGIQSYNLEQTPDPKLSIASTRSFGKSITSLEDIKQAISTYCVRLGEKLRQGGQAASHLQLFLLTDRFKAEYRSMARSISLHNQTNYTPDLIKAAMNLLDKIFVQGLEYKKAGVIVTGLTNQDNTASDLFDFNPKSKTKLASAMKVTDKINKKFGRNAIRPAQLGFGDKKWHMNRKLVSPRYTTVWREILVVR